MYQSRYHYENGKLAVAVDSLTGELLEFTNMETNENLIKNSAYSLHQPFMLHVADSTGEKKLFGGSVYDISRNPLLCPKITHTEDSNGIVIQVSFSSLTDGKENYAIDLTYTITLPTGTAESIWKLEFTNQQPDLIVQEARFPCINGIYFGEDWTDSTLVYPYQAGIKVENPIEVFAKESSEIYWKWQEYRYLYRVGSPAHGPNSEGLYAIEQPYSGNLSMTWLDYYGQDYGFYFANHSTESEICSLRAETFGPKSPGMNFSFLHHPYAEKGERWQSPPVVAAIHGGDWHVGARQYRAFKEQHEQVIPTLPAWFEKSPGLMAHYDFMYQNEGIVHRYKDIPELLEEGRALGISHLLLAGWHKDGFDNGFPEYYPSDELGGKKALQEGIKSVIDQGGHVCFYINGRLVNTKYDHLQKFIDDNVIIRKDGSKFIENYGNQDLNFAAMCINSSGWQDKMAETLRYITEEIGVDGVYLDQAAMATPYPCQNTEHGHAPSKWNQSYQKLYRTVIERRKQNEASPMSIIQEGVSDSYGGYAAGHLISTFSYHHIGAFPELYKYTFPEHILVDMLYPESNMAMRPVHVGQASTDIINRAFVTGCYFWIYDLVDDNTFTRDPKQYKYLQNVIALRKSWLELYGHGIFQDETYIREKQASLTAKFFSLDNGGMVACATKKPQNQSLVLTIEQPSRVQLATVHDSEVSWGDVQWIYKEGALHIELPAQEIMLVQVEYDIS